MGADSEAQVDRLIEWYRRPPWWRRLPGSRWWADRQEQAWRDAAAQLP